MLAGDFAGFPNGRRLEDDVTDIELRAFACGYGTVVGPVIKALGECDGNANRTPNNLLGDGVDKNDRPVPRRLPVRGRAAPGLRARPPQQRGWAVGEGAFVWRAASPPSTRSLDSH